MAHNPLLLTDMTIGFIGAGNMAEAMIAGLIRTSAIPPERILVSDAFQERMDFLSETYGVRQAVDNKQVIEVSTVAVFAVKPQQMTGVLSDLSEKKAFEAVATRLLVISVAAGIRLETFEKLIYSGRPDAVRNRIPIIRVMPNTPALVGAGMCAFSPNFQATPADTAITRCILETMGDVIECGESKMDAVTAVSGSGPAYCFYFIESMVDAGEKAGLSSREALELTLATMKGAIRLMEIRGETPAALRRKVTSPGGTTEAAIRVFQDNRFKESLVQAVLAAARRAGELSAPEPQ